MEMVMTNFGKQYKIIKKLGHEVYLVNDKENKYYAIKKIKIYDYEDNFKKIFNEIEKILIYISKIINNNIIKYYESEIKDNNFYILMEYAGNSDLKEFIKKYKIENLLIDEKVIKDIIIQICHGLKDIHNAKIIHRDLSPDNIFINENNKIKIGDFGIAAIINESNDSFNEQIGKIYYTAPEVGNGRPYNTKVNIYSLGCIIYELFTLNEYFKDKNYKEVAKIDTDIYNPKWQELIDLLLKEDYHERPDIEEIYDKVKFY